MCRPGRGGPLIMRLAHHLVPHLPSCVYITRYLHDAHLFAAHRFTFPLCPPERIGRVAISPSYDVLPAERLVIRDVDGAGIPALLVRPAGAGPWPAVVVQHGY